MWYNLKNFPDIMSVFSNSLSALHYAVTRLEYHIIAELKASQNKTDILLSCMNDIEHRLMQVELVIIQIESIEDELIKVRAELEKLTVKDNKPRMPEKLSKKIETKPLKIEKRNSRKKG